MRTAPILLAFLLGVWTSGPALAQSRTTGVLTGNVVDQGGAVISGATVQIGSSALVGKTRTTTTDEQGRFRFSDLPPGEYDVTATSDAHWRAEVEDVPVLVGVTASVPLLMRNLSTKETIVVSAAPPAIDTSSSSVPTILTHDVLRNIPNDRETSHILDLAPGINLESAYGGGEESGNAYQIDGVDVSDPQGGAPFALFNYSLLDEVQLTGLGAPAEYGQFTGVVFNSVTKSGGNASTGSADAFYGGQLLTGPSNLEDLHTSIDIDLQSSLQVGGPIRRDKLWYFFSTQYLKLNSSEGGSTQRELDPRLFLKFTSRARENGSLQGWLEWEHGKVTGSNANEFTPRAATTNENNPALVGNLSFNSLLSPNSLLDVAWSGYSGHHDSNPVNGLTLPGHVDAQTGFFSVNAPQFGVVNRSRNQINASLSRHSNLIAGFHDFKVGTEIERSRVRDRFGSPGDAFYSDNEGPVIDPSTGKPDLYSLVSIGGGSDARGNNERESLYLQDSWRITPNFTLNPGVRLDRDRGKVAGGTVFRTNGLAPRIGFAWDVRGDGRNLVKAHYGRYYEALYSAFYYYLSPGAFAPLMTQRIFNTSGFRETLTTTHGQQYAIDPHIRQPRLDQYIIGFDHQLPRGIVLSSTLVYRKNADFIETVSRDGIFTPVQGDVPGTGQQVTLFDQLNPDTDVLIYTNPRGLYRKYHAAILSVTRPMRNNWQMAGSYVYSQTRGNIDNLGFDEFGIGANTPFFSGHFLDTPNSLVNATGRLTHDQTHQVKLQATRIFQRPHLSFSTNYTYHTGDTWTPISNCLLVAGANGTKQCYDFHQGPVSYFAEPRGSRRLKARNEVDLRTEWQHTLLGRLLSVDIDVFNLTNSTRATAVETLVGENLGEPANGNFARRFRIGFGLEW
ncbi:MAG TPA: TonB-dependent receptor [Thermoanaerobaculia bacterium]|nr:TonB-dependent receptor [Thermoanaerobaculia bacterium]